MKYLEPMGLALMVERGFLEALLEKTQDSINELDNLELNLICKQDEKDCKKEFHFVQTSRGICSAYNSLPMKSNFKWYPTQEDFHNIFLDKPSNYTLMSYNDINDMMIVMDLQNIMLHGHDSANKGFLFISFLDQLSWFDQHSMSLYLETGYQTSVLIKPKVKQATIEAYNYSPIKRNCYFEEELNLKYFQKYSQSNCEMECKLDQAMKIFNCIPIDHIFLLTDFSGGREICTENVQRNFTNYFLTNSENCECLEDCEQSFFQLSINRLPINEQSLCKQEIFSDKMQNKGGKIMFQLSESLDRHYLLGGLVDQLYCHQKLRQDVAILKVKTNMQNMAGSVTIQSATFFQKLGISG